MGVHKLLIEWVYARSGRTDAYAYADAACLLLTHACRVEGIKRIRVKMPPPWANSPQQPKETQPKNHHIKPPSTPPTQVPPHLTSPPPQPTTPPQPSTPAHTPNDSTPLPPQPAPFDTPRRHPPRPRSPRSRSTPASCGARSRPRRTGRRP